MAKHRDKTKNTLPAGFIGHLDLLIKRAEDHLERRGFSRKSWKPVINHIEYFEPNVIFDFTAKIGFGYNGTSTGAGRVKRKAFAAYQYAQVAALAHVAKRITDPVHLFALGDSIGSILQSQQTKGRIDHELRLRAEAGGKAKAGSVGALKIILRALLEDVPSATSFVAVNAFDPKRSWYVTLKQVLSDQGIKFETKTFDPDRGKIEYVYGADIRKATFGRVVSSLSELKNQKKSSRNTR